MVAREAPHAGGHRRRRNARPARARARGPVLFLEALEETRARAEHWARFGEDLARTARHHRRGYGWSEDYAFGPVAIANPPTATGPASGPSAGSCPSCRTLPAPLARRVEALARRLPELLPAHPGPGLLARRSLDRQPACRPDADPPDRPGLLPRRRRGRPRDAPPVRQPGPGFADAYGPLAPGWEERRAVYSLFPALVHVRLFGASYLGMAERFLSAAGV